LRVRGRERGVVHEDKEKVRKRNDERKRVDSSREAER
jgi:hypothetical protein